MYDSHDLIQWTFQQSRYENNRRSTCIRSSNAKFWKRMNYVRLSFSNFFIKSLWEKYLTRKKLHVLELKLRQEYYYLIVMFRITMALCMGFRNNCLMKRKPNEVLFWFLLLFIYFLSTISSEMKHIFWPHLAKNLSVWVGAPNFSRNLERYHVLWQSRRWLNLTLAGEAAFQTAPNLRWNTAADYQACRSC